jgi:hypothetical protein
MVCVRRLMAHMIITKGSSTNQARLDAVDVLHRSMRYFTALFS